MDKKILMLTMSCNKPYFQALLGAVMNTWARPLIQNKYPDITWFAYTSCDNRHPVPVVDFENHIIYVDCDDGLTSTYEKTQKAYNMIRNIVDYNYVVRTNTSVYVNIDKMLDYLSYVNEDGIMANYMRCSEVINGVSTFRFWGLIGFFMCMKKDYFDIAMAGDEIHLRTSNGCIAFESHDDLIMSQKIHDALGPDFPILKINPGSRVIMYKPCIEGDIDTEQFRKGFIMEYHDPNVINDQIMVRVRSLYEGDKRIEKGHEIEHMYELDSVLNN